MHRGNNVRDKPIPRRQPTTPGRKTCSLNVDQESSVLLVLASDFFASLDEFEMGDDKFPGY